MPPSMHERAGEPVGAPPAPPFTCTDIQHSMQQAPRDLAFAQAVLEGAVATRGPWRAHAGQPGRGRGGRSRGRGGQAPQGSRPPAGGSGGGRGAAKRRRPAPAPQQQQQQRVSNSSTEEEGASTGSSDSSGLAAYSRPGPQSTARAAFCTACDVWVPRRAGDWEVGEAAALGSCRGSGSSPS